MRKSLLSGAVVASLIGGVMAFTIPATASATPPSPVVELVGFYATLQLCVTARNTAEESTQKWDYSCLRTTGNAPEPWVLVYGI
ncbi:hypothetical protein BCF44_1399 [Kutzneria buriramensis]|uniref:Uncharacterized protein n=1 Tax=Kutzneria buriramensis TaxID=1045776 RepID=A0A3E0G7E7_9PSEU|nr:hypothetical protein BCF44_1399 [Kutzneria buriramensis]